MSENKKETTKYTKEMLALAYELALNMLINGEVKLFGSWTLAVELAGLDPKDRSLIRKREEYDDVQLLDHLRTFAIQNNVEPTKSDFKRGILPSYALYIERFGSLHNAYREAELSDVLQGPVGGQFEDSY